MLPKLAQPLSKIVSGGFIGKRKPRLTTEEKIAKLKEIHGLTHGKGKRKKKHKKK